MRAWLAALLALGLAAPAAAVFIEPPVPVFVGENQEKLNAINFILLEFGAGAPVTSSATWLQLPLDLTQIFSTLSGDGVSADGNEICYAGDGDADLGESVTFTLDMGMSLTRAGNASVSILMAFATCDGPVCDLVQGDQKDGEILIAYGNQTAGVNIPYPAIVTLVEGECLGMMIQTVSTNNDYQVLGGTLRLTIYGVE